MAQTIKSLIAPLIMMAGLALLPACWGLKRPAPVTGTATTGGSCATNPFNESCDETYAIARVLKISECIAGGAAATPTCADAVNANSCIADPFAVACETDPTFVAYIDRARDARATYCQLPTADSTLCTGATGSVQFDMACLDSPTGSPMHASCATRPSVVRICTDAPFTRTGCGNIPTIETLRIAHCEDSATAWDDGCVEATYTVATAARDTACLTHGINAATGGHADCAERANVLEACVATSPFAFTVCDAVEDIVMKRTTFCLQTTDNGGENPFHVRCEQDTHGDVSGAQEASCLANVSADDGCVALITQTCTDTPLAGVSCAGLDGHSGFLNTFCAKDDNATMLMECAMTPATLCPADPFGDMVTAGDGVIDCLADDDYDSDRQALCASGMEGNGECDTAVIAPAVCASSGDNANPFATFCSSTNNISGGDITAIRQDVVTLCFDGANPAMAVCQNTDTVVSALTTGNTNCELIGHAFTDRCAYTQFNDERTGFCTTASTAWNSECNNNAHGNPTEARGQACVMFGTGMNGDSSCDTNQEAKNFCGMSGNNPLATANMGCRMLENFADISKAYCVADPFTTTGCNGLNNFADIVGDYCVANPGEATCKTDYTAWNGTFTAGNALATAPDSTHTTNQFLSGLTGATALPTTDFTALTTTARDGHTANASPYLNLADIEHGFGGEADDGVMFFGGQLTDDSYRYYAGIYTTTDLGAPLTDVSQNGVWRAWMRTSGKDPENEAFTLTVDFNATTAMGTLKAFFQSTSGTDTALYYNIDGAFGINGVITGSVAIGTEDSNNSGSILASGDEYTLGKLTGLIGAEGVVAAFVSNTNTITADGSGDGTNPFVGGFVGIPALADHDAFSHHYAGQLTTLTTGEVAFATGSAVGLTNTGLTFTTADGEFDTFAVVEEGDGFALLFGQTAGDENRYRAGLLSGTNLGAPLSGTETNANWTGSVYVSRHLNGTTNVPMDVSLTLAVNFSAGTIGTASAVTTAPSETIAIIGRFGAGDATLPVGILGGTVTYNDGTTEHADLPLIGLIGAEGAIGVFHGGTDIDMVGGFSVSNP